ncbi:hypothetical protein LOD99_13084 [Oopsacas minuta]|uniref:Saposin B-type domain-containing protein n=1 Tax=Oopsacas minuta TaxID=111878 RepID=A0AAV7JAT3_9METZ|nr:hypothetical protein LOD99_13084 [Oopsacas minuta]
MKLGILLVGLALVGGAMGMSYIEMAEMDDLLGDGEVCSACTEAVKDLGEALDSKLELASDDLLDMACKKVWFLSHKTCKKYGREITKPIDAIILSYMKGDKLCKLLKACTESSRFTVDDFDLSDERTACVKCQLLANKGKAEVMRNKELLKEIVLAIMEDCGEDCTDMMNEFGVDFVDAVIGAFPEYGACSAIGKCLE